MKKLIIFFCLILILTACGKANSVTTEPAATEAAPATPVGDENTFLLSSLPDIGEYDSGRPRRWYEDYTSELIPRDDYGTLIPYAGDKKTFYDTYEDQVLPDYGVDRWSYGLCTPDGVVVTDPVFRHITLSSEGYYVLYKQTANPNDPYSDYVETAYLAKTDGSACEKVYEGTGYFYHVGGDLYCNFDYSWGEGELYFTYKDGVKTPLDVSYRSIYEDGDYFCAYKDEGSVLLDGDLKEVSDTHCIVYGASDEYYIFGEEGDKTNLYGIARVGSGEVVIPAGNNDVMYEDGSFIIYDGSTVSVYDDKMTLKSSFEPGEGGYVYAPGKGIICFADKDYNRRYFTYEGKEFVCNEYNYDYNSGYHIFNTALGSRIYDQDLNEVTYIFGMKFYSARPVANGLLVSGSFGRHFIYDTEKCLLDTIHSIDDVSYAVRLDKDGKTPLLQVYSFKGEPLFRAYGSYTHSDTAVGRLDHYINGGKICTAREDGTIITSLLIKE